MKYYYRENDSIYDENEKLLLKYCSKNQLPFYTILPLLKKIDFKLNKNDFEIIKNNFLLFYRYNVLYEIDGNELGFLFNPSYVYAKILLMKKEGRITTDFFDVEYRDKDIDREQHDNPLTSTRIKLLNQVYKSIEEVSNEYHNKESLTKRNK